jgi:hypothetical protein
VAPYQVGRAIPICIAFDIAAGTYDLWIDENLVLDDRPHNVTRVGIGSVLVSFGSDYDVTATTSTTWGAVKALFRSGAESR